MDKTISLLVQENKADKSKDMQQKQLKHCMLYFNYTVSMVIFTFINNIETILVNAVFGVT